MKFTSKKLNYNPPIGKVIIYQLSCPITKEVKYRLYSTIYSKLNCLDLNLRKTLSKSICNEILNQNYRRLDNN